MPSKKCVCDNRRVHLLNASISLRSLTHITTLPYLSISYPFLSDAFEMCILHANCVVTWIYFVNNTSFQFLCLFVWKIHLQNIEYFFISWFDYVKRTKWTVKPEIIDNTETERCITCACAHTGLQEIQRVIVARQLLFINVYERRCRRIN